MARGRDMKYLAELYRPSLSVSSPSNLNRCVDQLTVEDSPVQTSSSHVVVADDDMSLCGHDARIANLLDVVNHYDGFKHLNLMDQEKKDLVEYLKSL